MSEDWQSMNSAPRDCTWIEVKLGNGTIKRVHYACGDGDGLMPPFDGWFEDVLDSEGKHSWYREVANPIAWRGEAK